MKKNNPSQSLYITFGVIIAVLIAMIGYFTYLLISDRGGADDATINNSTVVNAATNTNDSTNNTNGKKNKNKNKETTNTNTDETDGLVEPEITEDTDEDAETIEDEDATDDETANETIDEVVAAEGEQVVTLYFTKSTANCGTVYPVKRAITPSDDLYGQIILETMDGPTAEETGYTTAIPAALGLRWVEYTSDGPVVYVNEAFNDLDDCEQKTAQAQLIETANAMFDLSEGTDGQVIVGHPEEETEEDSTAEETTDEETTE